VLLGLPINHIVTSSENPDTRKTLTEVVEVTKRLNNGSRTGLHAKEQLLLAPHFQNYALLLLKYVASRDESSPSCTKVKATTKKATSSTAEKPKEAKADSCEKPEAPPVKLQHENQAKIKGPSHSTVPLPIFGGGSRLGGGPPEAPQAAPERGAASSGAPPGLVTVGIASAQARADAASSSGGPDGEPGGHGDAFAIGLTGGSEAARLALARRQAVINAVVAPVGPATAAAGPEQQQLWQQQRQQQLAAAAGITLPLSRQLANGPIGAEALQDQRVPRRQWIAPWPGTEASTVGSGTDRPPSAAPGMGYSGSSAGSSYAGGQGHYDTNSLAMMPWRPDDAHSRAFEHQQDYIGNPMWGPLGMQQVMVGGPGSLPPGHGVGHFDESLQHGIGVTGPPPGAHMTAGMAQGGYESEAGMAQMYFYRPPGGRSFQKGAKPGWRTGSEQFQPDGGWGYGMTSGSEQLFE